MTDQKHDRQKLTLGIAGLGVVGHSLVTLLQSQKTAFLAMGADVEIAAVSARDRHKSRQFDLSSIDWIDNPVNLAKTDKINVFVELMGGSDGPALASVETALRHGKHVITANKALLALHGRRLAKLAEDNQVSLRYEAAVAGGVPVIETLRQGTSAAQLLSLSGIVNGTCNYILSRMESAGLSFQQALDEAQQAGYAEVDPTLDINGEDAAHKLTIMAMLAFNADIAYKDISVTGITAIQAGDIKAAKRLGCHIRLLAMAERDENGISLTVAPYLVPAGSLLGDVHGSDNCIILDSRPQGSICLAGPGAGGGPTASAVAADIMALAHGQRGPVYRVYSEHLVTPYLIPPEQKKASFYLRIRIKDETGVVAAVTDILATHNISIDSLHQPSLQKQLGVIDHEEDARLIITTQTALRSDIEQASKVIERQPFTLMPPSIMPILGR